MFLSTNPVKIKVLLKWQVMRKDIFANKGGSCSRLTNDVVKKNLQRKLSKKYRNIVWTTRRMLEHMYLDLPEA